MIEKILQQKAYKLFFSRGTSYLGLTTYPPQTQKLETTTQKRKITYLKLSPTLPVRNDYIVLLHPYLNSAKDFFIINGHVQLYQSLGYHVIVLDFNGFGESPFIDFDFPADIEAVVNEINEKYQPDRIFGHGISFGASHNIVYSTQKNCNFERIIIENCLDSNTTYYKKRNKPLYYLMKTLMTIFPSVNSRHDYITQGSLIKTPSNALLIYNDADTLTTVAMGKKIAAKLNIDHQLWITNGKHLEAIKIQPDDYKATISNFLKG